LLKNKIELRKAFSDQLRKTEALYTSFKINGMDKQYPITLRSGDTILPTSTGKRITRKVYAGDGCHRIALLLLDGHKTLLPEYCRISKCAEYQPLDNTQLLLQHLKISDEKYYSFLSLAYAEKTLPTKESLLCHVRKNNPARLHELEMILSIDEKERN